MNADLQNQLNYVLQSHKDAAAAAGEVMPPAVKLAWEYTWREQWYRSTLGALHDHNVLLVKMAARNFTEGVRFGIQEGGKP